MKDFCSSFSDYLVNQKSVSANTLESYVRDVEHFISYLTQNGRDDPASVDADQINSYIKDMKQNKKSDATITRNIASIRCFYQYMVLFGYTTVNPAKAIHLEKIEKKFPQILSGKEIELLLSQPDTREPKGCRDKAMLELLYATGIRATELVDLDIGSINLRTGMLRCSTARSERVIPVYPTAISAISDYIVRVRSHMITPAGGQALFVNLNGRRLTRQGFWKIVKGYAEQAKIVKEITPHTLRHSFALHLLENGAELKDIQAMMGHADISSTQVYVHLLNDHCKEVYNQCHPRAKLG
ncbi:Tyrosine recombinase XerD [Caprobacter fermentans]|uniref:Tyrosine recombinase n=1 Tax=Caproicibacter fermentans TaxID=2576756 RepID=A0A6N8I4H7_9FIRM|nr:tyrosine recombinase [Caproicibacter fermentans]MVB12954.1 Tyrosine recombinase XerD [Caproicibacter fermentans]OCN02506.1 site-specific tyrosine recombinase XerD [Clostridium sp. W14A]QNK41225.1 tyrosine recombinase [Caproicibacter fermentans]